MGLSGYEVRRIANAVAQDVVVREHYLHRRSPCSDAFGLFDATGGLLGVVCYGTPASAPLRSGICGPENSQYVAELTRLWVADTVPKNGESFLIGRSLPQVSKPIIVSFADTAQAHIGVVYQATNWLYTGLSAKRTDWTVRGQHKHGQSWADKYSATEIRERFGDDFSLQPRSRKHRYVTFVGPKRLRQTLRAALRYPVLPYPRAYDEFL